jgi:FKBP-type peptidyl-prolyl cis-trans isomerase
MMIKTNEIKRVAFLGTFFFCLAFVGCNTEGVKNKGNDNMPKPGKVNILDQDHKVIDTKKLGNGLRIDWFVKGKGPKVNKSDLVLIDYKVKLKDGKEVDGNHLLGTRALPFVVGFNMQTKGWDLAFNHLNEGDFVRILIPSPLARGVDGIKGLIPPNADNWLILRVLKIAKPDRVVDGTKVWVLQRNKKFKDSFGPGKLIAFHAMASSESSPLYMNTFRQDKPYIHDFDDKNIVPGLRKALINAKSGDRIFMVAPPSQAYGNKGYMDFVKPNESVFYNLFILDVKNK